MNNIAYGCCFKWNNSYLDLIINVILQINSRITEMLPPACLEVT